MSVRFGLASVFGDHMVLCRGKNIRMFGTAEDGKTVTVQLAGNTVFAVAASGRFEAVLPPMEAGGPYTVTVSDGTETHTVSDVLIGDVFFAGGQSNMFMKLEASQDGAVYTAQANEPEIRYCNFPVQTYLDEEALEKERETHWQALTGGQCGDISAIAFHFARKLHPAIKVPIGIIDCAMGGTPIACWLDEHALRTVTGGAAVLDGYLERTWGQTHAQYDEECRRHKLRFEDWSEKADAIKKKNPSVTDDELTDLLGKAPWPPPEGYRYIHRPCGLVETMVKRVAPYTLTAILYYQGETDADHPAHYRALLTTLIAFWRDLFLDRNLPFLMVQLPVFALRNERTPNSWALIRHAQDLVCQNTRNAGLVCMIDRGEAENLHPKEKKTVGERLCLQVLRVVYHQEVEADSPRAVSARPQGQTMIVSVSAPLQKAVHPALFEVAGADGVFQPAEADMEGKTIRMFSNTVKNPCYARYAWVNFAKVEVFGENGLPLAPFLLP